MSRDIWKGTLSFGLVEIPVALVSAENVQEEVKLSFLDRRDFSPVGYRRYNKTTDAEVPWSEIVHGYEYEKGEYVALSKQDLEHASPEMTKTISIRMFVAAGEVEPIYFDKPYYVTPTKEKSKAYALLREVLERTGKVGIATLAVRTREHVAAVGVRGKAITVQLLRFASEVRAPEDLERVDYTAAKLGVSRQEIEMAERLVDDMTGKWDPKEYRDEYADDLMKMIKAKIASGKVHAMVTRAAPSAKKPKSDVLDLMPLLKQSVAGARGLANGRKAAGSRSRGAATRKPSGRARRSA